MFVSTKRSFEQGEFKCISLPCVQQECVELLVFVLGQSGVEQRRIRKFTLQAARQTGLSHHQQVWLIGRWSHARSEKVDHEARTKLTLISCTEKDLKSWFLPHVQKRYSQKDFHAGVTGPGSDEDYIPPAEHGPKISGPRSHLLAGGNLVLEKFWGCTTTPLSGPEFLGPRSAGGMECRSEPGPETPGMAVMPFCMPLILVCLQASGWLSCTANTCTADRVCNVLTFDWYELKCQCVTWSQCKLSLRV